MKAFLLFSSLLVANIITPAQAMDEAQYNEADARYLTAVNGDKNSVYELAAAMAKKGE